MLTGGVAGGTDARTGGEGATPGSEGETSSAQPGSTRVARTASATPACRRGRETRALTQQHPFDVSTRLSAVPHNSPQSRIETSRTAQTETTAGVKVSRRRWFATSSGATPTNHQHDVGGLGKL